MCSPQWQGCGFLASGSVCEVHCKALAVVLLDIAGLIRAPSAVVHPNWKGLADLTEVTVNDLQYSSTGVLGLGGILLVGSYQHSKDTRHIRFTACQAPYQGNSTIARCAANNLQPGLPLANA